MEKFWLVIEIQEDANGNRAEIHYFKTDWAEAVSTVHTMIAAAAVSQLPYHAAFMVTSEGVIEEGRVFDRRSAEEGGE